MTTSVSRSEGGCADPTIRVTTKRKVSAMSSRNATTRTVEVPPLPLPSFAAAVQMRARGAVSAADLAAIEAKRPDPSATGDVFIWSCRVAVAGVDHDFWKLSVRAQDGIVGSLQDGISFLAERNVRELPLGQSYNGRRITGAVVGDFFTVPGVKLGTVDTTSFITAVRAGVVRHVSLHLSAIAAECSLCGKDPWGWRVTPHGGDICNHIAGVRYEKRGGVLTAVKTGGEVCVWNILEARANAASAVHHVFDDLAILDAKLAELRARGVVVDGYAATVLRSVWMRSPSAGAPVKPSRAESPAALQARMLSFISPGHGAFAAHWQGAAR